MKADSPRALRAEETRQIVMETAARMFRARPFDAVTMRDIAREAGVSTGALFCKATDKEDLWLKALGLPYPWRPAAWAPKDGELLILLVDYREHRDDPAGPWTPLEDELIARTIGSNNEDLVGPGEGGWSFAGWSWTQDCWLDGAGKVIGYMRLDEIAPAASVQAAVGTPA
jgi:hypothetical protein